MLARKPSQITVLEIIEAIEGKIVFQRCKLQHPVCEHVGGCAVCELFEQAQDGVKEVLARTTLSRLIREKARELPASRRPGHRTDSRLSVSRS